MQLTLETLSCVWCGERIAAGTYFCGFKKKEMHPECWAAMSEEIMNEDPLRTWGICFYHRGTIFPNGERLCES